jgi:hypothetical protein
VAFLDPFILVQFLAYFFSKYFVRLNDPHIYNLLKACIFPQDLHMDEGSKIIQPFFFVGKCGSTPFIYTILPIYIINIVTCQTSWKPGPFYHLVCYTKIPCP